MLHQIGFFIKVPPALLDVVHAAVPAECALITLQTASAAEMLERAPELDALICTKASGALIAAAPRLKFIQHAGVGVDGVDLAAATARGIPVAICPHGTTESVAEHTLMLMLAVSRRLVELHGSLGAGQWLMWERRTVCHNLRGRTLGLVGAGRIGQAVAARAQAFGMRVRCHDLCDVPGLERVPLDELYATSDIISLHAPLTPETHRMIGAAQLAQMKRGVLIINCARGELIDEGALHAALLSGQVGGAGLDVFEREPPARDNPLLHLPQVIATPHTANGTFESFVERTRFYFENIQRALRGEAPTCVLPSRS